MSLDRSVLAVAGSLFLLSLELGYFVSPYWFLLGGSVGLNLFPGALTGFCPTAYLLGKSGFRPGAAFVRGGAALRRR